MPSRHLLFRRAAALAASLPLLLGAAPPAAAAETTVTALAPMSQAVTPGTAKLIARVSHNGASVAGVPVQFWVRHADQKFWRLATKTTDSTGHVYHSFSATGRYAVFARFAGNAKYARSDSKVGSITEKPLGVRAVEEASRHRGAPYQYGAVGPYRFDCSGFTLYVFSRLGKKLPHNSGQQYSSVTHVSQASKRVGDLVFMTSGGRIYHVGIFAGYVNGQAYMWDSPHSGSYVTKRAIWSGSYLVGRVA